MKLRSAVATAVAATGWIDTFALPAKGRADGTGGELHAAAMR